MTDTLTIVVLEGEVDWVGIVAVVGMSVSGDVSAPRA